MPFRKAHNRSEKEASSLLLTRKVPSTEATMPAAAMRMGRTTRSSSKGRGLVCLAGENDSHCCPAKAMAAMIELT